MLGPRVPGSPIDNLYENASPREYQLWWDHYLRYHPTPITTLFYGYSITTSLCSHCHAQVSTLSAFNTLYITLPLTQTRLNVNLVHQFLDLSTGHVSLRTEPIYVKVGPSASLRDVQAAVLASLAGEWAVVLLVGTYDLDSRSIESYRLADLAQPVSALQSDGQRNFFLLAYPVAPRRSAQS